MNFFTETFQTIFNTKNFRSLKWFLKYKLYNYLFIEPHYIFCSIFNNNVGIVIDEQTPHVVVSLTSIPERIDRAFLTVETLLQQSFKPNKIILWLSEGHFSEDYLQKKNRFTRRLLKMKRRGLSIEFCKDIRSYTKIIYALEQYPDSIIVSADDDLYYPRNWLKELYDSYLEEPLVVHCHFANCIKVTENGKVRSHSEWLAAHEKFEGSSYNVFPFTGQGCLFPPGSFNNEVFNKEIFLSICPNHDDAWFKGMTILNGVKSKKIKSVSKHWQTVRGTDKKTITSIIIDGKQFDPQVKAVFDKYDLYKYLDR